jgi:hypothetical protein
MLAKKFLYIKYFKYIFINFIYKLLSKKQKYLNYFKFYTLFQESNKN